MTGRTSPAVSAAETMALALRQLLDHDQRPPCGGSSDAWMSEDHRQRAAAARRCSGCPVIALCAAVATEVKASFGVWAGTDRTPTSRKAKP